MPLRVCLDASRAPEENECGGVVRDLVPSGGARHPRILSAASTPSLGALFCFRTVNPCILTEKYPSHSKAKFPLHPILTSN